MPGISSQLQLTDIIKTRIENEGPLSFCDFMEMALYHPGMGYYTSPREKIGKAGDFYTSACVTPVFGALIGKQLEEMYHALGGNQFTVVEYGAGTGLLARHVLTYLQDKKDLYEKLNYCIIEKSPAMVEKAKQHLKEKVSWHTCIDDLTEINGCILSNELVDNFSVHRVVMEDELMEVFVDYKGEFTEVLKPARAELKNYLAELHVTLPKGFRTEINLEATVWMKNIASALKKGYVITIDYGHPSSELYDSCRRNGTLLCYKKHATSQRLYEAIGEQDITSHVNFSALCLWGHKYGLHYCGYRNQGDFLLALGFKEQIKKYRQQQFANDLLKYEKEAFLSHLLIEDMGNKFKVLIQRKNTGEKELSGLAVGQ